MKETISGSVRLVRKEVIRDVVENRRYRILYVPEEGDTGYWICLDASGNIPHAINVSVLLNGIASRKYEAVVDTFRPESGSPSAASIEIRDRAYALIRDIVEDEPDVYDTHKRAALLRGCEKKTGVKMNNLYNYLGKYWRGGMTADALLPAFYNCGTGRKETFVASKPLGRPKQKGKNGKILTEEDYEKFRKAIRDHYIQDKKPALTETYDWMIAHMYVRPRFPGDTDPEPFLPDEKPSFTQFYYWHRKHRDVVEEAKGREGQRYSLTARGETGKSETTVKGPGIVAQIDATIGDFYLVRENNRNEIIGRPVVFFVKDVASRMVMGMYVTLENTSWDCALMALKNTAEDKVEFCRQYGIEITPEEWPCRHLPLSITADNGEMGDRGVEDVIAQLGIMIENTPPYRGDLKAVIENTFNKMNCTFRYIVPGHVDKDDGQRGSINRRKEACLDIRSFTQLLIRAVLFFNNSFYMKDYQKSSEMQRLHVRPIPREIWNYGMQYETGALRVISREDIYRVLLPKDRASVTERGIVFKDLYYTCEKAERELWYDRARSGGRWKIPITYDPTCVSHIYFYSEEGNMITCSLLQRSSGYTGNTSEEMDRIEEENKAEEAAHSQEQEKAKTNLILEMEATVKRCQNEKKEEGKKKVGSVLNKHRIKAGRQAEKDTQSGRTAALEKQAEPVSETGPAEEFSSADDAMNDSIDQALRDAGLYD